MNSMRGSKPPRAKERQPSCVRLKPCLAGAECTSSTAELQLCSEALSGRVPGSRLLCPGRGLPRLASLLGFLHRKEQAARGWEMHWRLPGLSSAPALPLHLGPRRPWGGLRGRWLAHSQGLQQ